MDSWLSAGVSGARLYRTLSVALWYHCFHRACVDSPAALPSAAVSTTV